jgi:hypothetical protein
VRLSFSLLLGTITLVGGIAVHMLRKHVRDLLLRAKHLFVTAMVVGADISKSQTFAFRQPAAMASCSVPNQRSPWSPLIRVLS